VPIAFSQVTRSRVCQRTGSRPGRAAPRSVVATRATLALMSARDSGVSLSVRRFGVSVILPRGDGEQPPFPGHAFELVSAAVLELKS
jgi:hypothetical protein